MPKMSKIQCIECNVLNGMHVEDIEDTKIHVLFVIYSHLYSSKSPQAGGRGLGKV